ncbi:MAG: AraC family transcriptional regulator [Lachnospiraceae bacterium]|nr:AraC family transcriptional regulator [Lachnospiraceae bacterium]
MNQIILNEDSSERLEYDMPDFPVYLHHDYEDGVNSRVTLSHWHHDIEFLIILQGHIMYNINGTDIELNTGEGVVVNARQFHFEHSEDKTPCEYICLIIHPQLLCANEYVRRTFVEPVLSNRNFEYFHLHPGVEWENEILKAVIEVDKAKGAVTFPLVVESNFTYIWQRIFEHVSNIDSLSPKKRQQLAMLLDMTGYMHKHYTEKISLSEIAGHGNVCESTCTAIFKNFTGKTPIIYLNDYRLKKSLDYLVTSDLSISEISELTGFNGASYYTEQFKKKYGCSPTEYRKR